MKDVMYAKQVLKAWVGQALARGDEDHEGYDTRQASVEDLGQGSQAWACMRQLHLIPRVRSTH